MSDMLLAHGSPRLHVKCMYLNDNLIYPLVKKCVFYHVSFLTRILNSRAVIG